MFIEPYFYWKGKCCKDFNLMIITERAEVINEIGVPYSQKISQSDSLGNIFYEVEDEDTEEFTLSLCLANDNNEALEWTEDIFTEIVNWLVSDNFEEFRSFDNLNYIYFLKVTKIQKKFTFDNTGWIDVTFKPFSNYAYKKYVVKEKVNGKKVVNVYNELPNIYEPLITLENFGTKDGTIRIDNFVIKNLDKNQVVYIDNYMSVVKNDKNENLLPFCNRKWIRLKPGENKILLYGNFNIEIICMFPKII